MPSTGGGSDSYWLTMKGGRVDATINKGGSAVISVSLNRTGLRPIDTDRTLNEKGLRNGSFGLSVTVKADPMVEDLIRSMGSGEFVDVKTIGRYWVPPTKETVLNVYMVVGLTGMQQAKHGPYRFDRPAAPLTERAVVNLSTGQIDTIPNLSFLRLVGIGEQDGVTFGVKGVHTEDAIVEMHSKIKLALKDFCQSYMKPISLNMMMVTQEL